MAKLYHVVWEIDIHAQSPRDAANEARAIQRDKDAIATVFDVTEAGSDKTVRIDLAEDLRDIAEAAGAPLSNEEIDVLCERINFTGNREV